MKTKRSFLSLLAVFGVMLVGLALSLLGKNNPQFTSQKVSISGIVPSAVSKAHYLQHADPKKQIDVLVGLKLRKQDELTKLIEDQANPSSSEYRRYINPADFISRFSPTQNDYDSLVAYFKGQGLTIVATADNRLLICVRGTVDQLEKAFNVSINEYDVKGKVERSIDKDPQIPSYLVGMIDSVMGLHTFSEFHSNRRQLSAKASDEPWGLTPQQVASAYNFPNGNNAHALTQYSGKGYRIAIATAYTYKQNDVDEYWKQFGIKRTGTVTNIPVGGISFKYNAETTLDLEQAGAQAPGANILMYMGKDAEDATFALVFNQIAMDNLADVVSLSWGLCEHDTGPATMKTYHAIFSQCAVQGIPVFCASGDNGAFDCKDKDTEFAVDYPSADPYVTAVGGTSLRIADDNSRIRETAWTGSGGGVSTMWPRQSWQTGAGVPAGDKRVTADVALVSDPWTGYTCYFDGQWQLLGGGTSFAAPNWAALWTLADEAYGKRMGSVNDAVYRIGRSNEYGRVFLDITVGHNGNHKARGFQSGPMWDHPTGWGVPNGGVLVDWLKDDNKKPVSP